MLHLHGIGHFHPENEITNAFLEELDIGTSDSWIVERTGIRSRRTVLSLDYIRTTHNRDVRAADEAAVYSNAELARRAAGLAIARAGIDRSEIGLVVGAGSVPEHVTPAEGCTIAAALDLDVPAFDIRSACTSFGAALHVLAAMREDSLPAYVLLAAPEAVTRVVDYTDRRAAVLWGDAAVAAVLSPASASARATVLCSHLDSRPEGHDKVVVPRAGHFEQEGATVQSFAIRTTASALQSLQREFGAVAGDRLHFIGHQANLLMLENAARRCTIDNDHHHFNVVRFGNTATAGAPSVLSELWERFHPGDHVAIVAVGAGFTWSSVVLRFDA